MENQIPLNGKALNLRHKKQKYMDFDYNMDDKNKTLGQKDDLKITQNLLGWCFLDFTMNKCEVTACLHLCRSRRANAAAG